MISGFAKYAGGLENVVSELTSFLASRKSKVTIFGRYNTDFSEIFQECKTVGVRPYDILPQRLRFAHYYKYSYSLKVWRKIKNEGPFDIIHGHGDNCFFPSLFRDNTPFIMTFHGTHACALPKLGPRLLPVYCTEKVAASRCDIAIACSKAVKDELTTFYGVNPNKVKVIYNGVNVDKFVRQDKIEARKKLNLPSKHKYGIWVGTNPHLKGLSIARKAMEGLGNVHLLVAGVKAKNSGTARYFGNVNDSHLLLNLYNAADFLIFPTLYEGFPLVPLEAMACGVPIIVSEESNVGEIIKDGVHGFVVKNRNPLSYKDRIELLLNDAEMLSDMSVQCRKLAVGYSWKKQAEKYWKVYLESLSLRV
jgi:glycosyltransferase involved in cell wall biosynthesis